METSSSGTVAQAVWKRLRFLVILVLITVLLEAATSMALWTHSGLQKTHLLSAFWMDCLYLYLHIVLLGGALVVVETAMPGSSVPKRYGDAIVFWAWYVPAAILSAHAVQAIVAYFGIKPLFSFRLSGQEGGKLAMAALSAAMAFAAMFLFDFFFYWFHRMQHAVPMLWAFHSVHHANRSLNALGCYHHPLDEAWKIPLFLLPMALTFQLEAPRLALVSAFITGWAMFNHMDSSFNLGRLRHALADNHYHRVHHSVAKEHHDCNFAGFFAPWDKLFGTQVMPPRDVQHLPVGLADTSHPQTVAQYLWLPFSVLKARIRDRKAAEARRA